METGTQRHWHTRVHTDRQTDNKKVQHRDIKRIPKRTSQVLATCSLVIQRNGDKGQIKESSRKNRPKERTECWGLGGWGWGETENEGNLGSRSKK